MSPVFDITPRRVTYCMLITHMLKVRMDLGDPDLWLQKKKFFGRNDWVWGVDWPRLWDSTFKEQILEKEQRVNLLKLYR